MIASIKQDVIFTDIKGRIVNIWATNCANTKHKCKYCCSLQYLNYWQSKTSLWRHNTEKTHYSWSARNYLYGAECRTIQVILHFHTVLSIGLSNCKLVHFKESYYQKAWHTFLFSLSSTQLMLFCKVSSHSNLKQWITGLQGSFCLGKRSSGKSREERPFYCIWLD